MGSMPSIRNYVIYLTPFLSGAVLFFMLTIASPLAVGPAGILIVFGLLYALIFSTLYGLMLLTSTVVQKFTSVGFPSRRKIYYMISIIAFGPVFLLALNSIGQLDTKDFILVVLFLIIACFYVSRRVR